MSTLIYLKNAIGYTATGEGGLMGKIARRNRVPAREQADDRKEHWTPSLATVAGSAALWAWGFLAYLSPALFPVGKGAETTGLEIGFFASQATVVVSAVLLIVISRRTVVTFGRGTLLLAAGAMTIVSLAIPAAIAAEALGLLIGLGIVSGIAASLCGIAWGARYSLGSSHAPATILLSFLLAYGLYLVTSRLIPFPFRALVVTALPILSWAFWADDAAKRHQEHGASPARRKRHARRTARRLMGGPRYALARHGGHNDGGPYREPRFLSYHGI